MKKSQLIMEEVRKLKLKNPNLTTLQALYELDRSKWGMELSRMRLDQSEIERRKLEGRE